MFSHGQKRVKRPKQLTEKQILVNQQTEKVCVDFLDLRKNYAQSGKSLDELLQYSTNMLELMSDQSTVMNFRQELVEKKFQDFFARLSKAMAAKEDPSGITGEIKEFIKREVMLNTKLAMADLKSYQLWFYRLWLLKKYMLFEKKLLGAARPEAEAVALPETKAFKLISKDLKMSEKFLMKDERNFHTWNYRFNLWNSVLQVYPDARDQILKEELAFLDAVHAKNYSNYSTIHFKMKIYQRLVALGQDLDAVFFGELDKIYEGLFISPNEQALYLFQRWLFDQVKPRFIVSVERLEANSNHFLR